MTAKDDFTDDEWFRLRSAPWQAAMGVIEIDPSGPLVAGRELQAVEAALGAVQFEESLRGLVTRELLDEDRTVGDDKPSPGATAAAETLSEGSFPDRVIEAMAELDAILTAKVDADEAATFRAWLVELATGAAEAGKEGALGLTGPKVSDTEAAYLDRLRAALGLG